MTAQAREIFVQANGLRHHVLEWGRDEGATPFVLCHGFLDIAWSWQRVAARLAEAGHRVLAFDWRGHGETDWVGPGGYYHFPDYLLDLDALLSQLTARPVHLVGHSMGGTACGMYAGVRPDRVGTLTLIEGLGPPTTDPAVAPERVRALLRARDRIRSKPVTPMPDVAEALRRLRAAHPNLDDDWGRWVATHATREVEGGRAFRFDPMHKTPSPTPFQWERLKPYLERVDAPTLLVFGEDGFRLPDEATRVAALRNAQQVEFPRVGHMVHWFASDALADQLLDFAG